MEYFNCNDYERAFPEFKHCRRCGSDEFDASGKLIEEGCWMDMEVMVDGEILTFYHCCSLHREDITPKVIQRIRALKLDEPDEPDEPEV